MDGGIRIIVDPLNLSVKHSIESVALKMLVRFIMAEFGSCHNSLDNVSFSKVVCFYLSYHYWHFSSGDWFGELVVPFLSDWCCLV